jgi:alkanesulfonate monooxygenase SsuD/methylene tetrahydromethanopterin reductase-like flavin-dependent oxidoreductase (luciferase family)
MGKVKDFGFMPITQKSGRELIRLAKLAEDLGYGTCWLAEDPYVRGPFTTMATIAAHTKKIRISTAVTNPNMRHPVCLAMELSALDDFSEGRAVLGMGAGGPFISNQLNLPWHKHTTTLRETMDIFEPLIRGETVNYDGDRFKVSGVSLTIPPYRPKTPIYLGSVGPKNVQLCGERADGLLLGLGMELGAKKLAYFRDNLTIGAAKSGRDISDLDVTLLMTLSLSENDKEARERVKPMILKTHLGWFRMAAKRVLSASYNEALCGAATSDLPASFYEALGEYLPHYSHIDSSWDGMSALTADDFKACKAGNPLDLITDDIIDLYTIAGDPERCKERIARLAEGGINSFMVVDAGFYDKSLGDIEPTMRMFQEKIMPEFL